MADRQSASSCSPITLAACRRQRSSRLRWVALCAGFLLLAVTACERRSKPPEATPEAASVPVVYTTFYPTTYFVERIAGDTVKAVCPCPPDADPAYWMPDDATIAAYQQADLIVLNGAEFEKWPGKVTLPESRIVNTAKTLEAEWITLTDVVVHSHGPDGAHTHTGVDGHTWLDPVNCKVQALEIKKALARRFPTQGDVFEAGYAALVSDLEALDARHKALAPVVQRRFLLASHPAYNYVARRYGWRQKYFHLDPEQMPDEQTLDEIKVFLDRQPARYLLWETAPAKEVAAGLRERFGLKSVVFAPVESIDASQRSQGKDFISLMNENLDRLQEALGV